MKPDCSLPRLQMPATHSYPEPYQSSPCPPSHFLKIQLNILPSTPVSCKFSFSLGCPHQNPVYASPLHSTCPAHDIILYFVTRIIFGEQHRPLSSWLYIFIHSPVTSSLLGPHILLNILFSKTLRWRSSLNLNDKFCKLVHFECK